MKKETSMTCKTSLSLSRRIESGRRTGFKKNDLLIIIISIFFINSSLQAMNILQPWEPLVRPDYSSARMFQVYSLVEAGYNQLGLNSDGTHVNVLQIYNREQNALKMLDGFPVSSCIGQKRIQVDADDDGVRGHFNVCGDLKLLAAFSFNLRCFFTDAFSVGFYFPFLSMRLNDVYWQNLTQDIDEQDFRVRELLTDHFFSNVCALGGPSLGSWHRTGPGDATIMLEWYRDFRQNKPMLKNVRINWRVGLTMPTGLRADEDKLFAIPFGYDGAFSIPYGLGLDLILATHLRVGVDVQLTHVFDNTRLRRIKTDLDQTDLLLLQKVWAHKDWGMVQRFDLYVELYRFLSGLSAKVGYQYLKQGDSTLSFACNEYSSRIANTAQSLQDYTMHMIIPKINYDFQAQLGPDCRVRPQIGLFGRFPFNGKRVALVSTLGVALSFDF